MNEIQIMNRRHGGRVDEILQTTMSMDYLIFISVQCDTLSIFPNRNGVFEQENEPCHNSEFNLRSKSPNSMDLRTLSDREHFACYGTAVLILKIKHVKICGISVSCSLNYR